MTKRIFAISTLALILLVGAIFVYNFAFKKPSTPTTQTKTADEGKTATSTTSSATASEKASSATTSSSAITALSQEKVFGATLAPDGKTIYYFTSDTGQVDQVDFTGKLEKVVSTEEFQNIKNIVWSKQKNRAIVERADGPDKSKFLYLDLAQKKVSPLKDNVDSVSWSSFGDKIIYKYYDSATKKRTLNVADPDGSNWHKVADVDYFGVEISPIASSSDLSFWPAPDAYTSSVATLINFSGENKREILKDRFGVDLLWSPNGLSAAVSFTDQKGGKKTDLAVMNADGGQFQVLNFPTFAKKCAWSADSKNIFCAMPGNIPDTAILPNDWQSGQVETADTFWKIEVASGKKTRLIEADKIGGSYDALNPFLSQDEKTLFFTNKVDGMLYKLDL